MRSGLLMRWRHRVNWNRGSVQAVAVKPATPGRKVRTREFFKNDRLELFMVLFYLNVLIFIKGQPNFLLLLVVWM